MASGAEMEGWTSMEVAKGRVGRRRSTSWEHISDVAIDLFMARGLADIEIGVSG